MACLLRNDVIDCTANFGRLTSIGHRIFPNRCPLYSLPFSPFSSLACPNSSLQAAINESSLAPAQDADRILAKLERLPILPGALVPNHMARVLPIVTRDQLKMLCYHTLSASLSISMLAESFSSSSLPLLALVLF